MNREELDSELAASTLLVVGALFPIVNPQGDAPFS